MSAIISDCGKYRYRLDRMTTMPRGPVFAFFGINPSTADASVDDATIRKMRAFVHNWRGRGFIVGNVFAYRATDPRELASEWDDPVGPDNLMFLDHIVKDADVLVPCWGNRSKAPKHLAAYFDLTLQTLGQSGKPIMMLGEPTMAGDPRHPLFLPLNTPLIDFRSR